jgi:16S rRNA (cytosine1402-N4)-methyltransferase
MIGCDQADSASPRHVPVLLAEVLHALRPATGELFIDATFGAGGYTRAILQAADCRVLAIDRDPTAIAAGAALVARSAGRLTLCEGRFGSVGDIARARLGESGDEAGLVDGIVLDIGVSSMQIDDAARGFSFMSDGPLDMRMGADGASAADIVAEASDTGLARILAELGEERLARRIARAIVREREIAPITTTRRLADIVSRAAGRQKPGDKHPATRTFQALRIHVNDELGELAAALHAAERLLRPGGRLAVVTFHSLEDRVVKRFLARRARPQSQGSRHAPPTHEPVAAPSFNLVEPRPIAPGDAEVAANPRARSAKLRSAERTTAPPWLHDSAEALGVPQVDGAD